MKKINGVNLGNWLVLEKWMSPALFDGTTAEDEYYLAHQLSPQMFEMRLKIHRSEYITERDFAHIAHMGMNSVRIPIPYFIFGDRPPFVGCIEELDKAFCWAEKYGLSILLDLHTVPMSQNGFDILARKLTSVHARITTKMDFIPEVHQHSAGLILYYDNMNYINLRKYYSETLGRSALSIIHLENGEKTEFLNTRIPVDDVPIYLRLTIEGRKAQFFWSYDNQKYHAIGRCFATAHFSDEYCKFGEFTGTMVGITCADRVKHSHYADFDFFEYLADEDRPVDD